MLVELFDASSAAVDSSQANLVALGGTTSYSVGNSIAKGYGESKLLIENAETEEEHAKNRRTEFKVIGFDLTLRNQKRQPLKPHFLFDCSMVRVSTGQVLQFYLASSIAQQQANHPP